MRRVLHGAVYVEVEEEEEGLTGEEVDEWQVQQGTSPADSYHHQPPANGRREKEGKGAAVPGDREDEWQRRWLAISADSPEAEPSERSWGQGGGGGGGWGRRQARPPSRATPT